MDRIDFYFEFSSPYGYFASTQISELAKKYGYSVDWHPFMGEDFKPTNSGTGLSQIPTKNAYLKMDQTRTAAFHNIPFQHPTHTSIDTRVASRAVLFAETQYGERKGIELTQAIFKAYYVDDLNIADTNLLGDLAKALEIDATELIAQINSANSREQLRAEIDLASAKGVFGSPFFVVNGETFWGFDRLEQLEATLKKRAQTN